MRAFIRAFVALRMHAQVPNGFAFFFCLLVCTGAPLNCAVRFQLLGYIWDIAGAVGNLVSCHHPCGTVNPRRAPTPGFGCHTGCPIAACVHTHAGSVRHVECQVVCLWLLLCTGIHLSMAQSGTKSAPRAAEATQGSCRRPHAHSSRPYVYLWVCPRQQCSQLCDNL
jgi:hypothetical protein